MPCCSAPGGCGRGPGWTALALSADGAGARSRDLAILGVGAFEEVRTNTVHDSRRGVVIKRRSLVGGVRANRNRGAGASSLDDVQGKALGTANAQPGGNETREQRGADFGHPRKVGGKKPHSVNDRAEGTSRPGPVPRTPATGASTTTPRRSTRRRRTPACGTPPTRERAPGAAQCASRVQPPGTGRHTRNQGLICAPARPISPVSWRGAPG